MSEKDALLLKFYHWNTITTRLYWLMLTRDFNHGRPQKFFKGLTSTFCLSVQVVYYAVQMDVHENAFPFVRNKEKVPY